MSKTQVDTRLRWRDAALILAVIGVLAFALHIQVKSRTEATSYFETLTDALPDHLAPTRN